MALRLQGDRALRLAFMPPESVPRIISNQMLLTDEWTDTSNSLKHEGLKMTVELITRLIRTRTTLDE